MDKDMSASNRDFSNPAPRTYSTKTFNPKEYNIKPNMAKVKGRFRKVEIRVLCVGCKEVQQCYITNKGECISDAFIKKTSWDGSSVGCVLNVNCKSAYLANKSYVGVFLTRLKTLFTIPQITRPFQPRPQLRT